MTNLHSSLSSISITLFVFVISLSMVGACESDLSKSDKAYESVNEQELLAKNAKTIKSASIHIPLVHKATTDSLDPVLVMKLKMESNKNKFMALKRRPGIETREFRKAENLLEENAELEQLLTTFLKTEKENHARFNQKLQDDLLELDKQYTALSIKEKSLQ